MEALTGSRVEYIDFNSRLNGHLVSPAIFNMTEVWVKSMRVVACLYLMTSVFVSSITNEPIRLCTR